MTGLPSGIALSQESIALARELGVQAYQPHALRVLGDAAGDLGDYTRAKAVLEEALSMFRELEDRWGILLTAA